jgi:hypothetical protein
MRKLLVSTFLTLDRVMQAPGGSEEDDSSNFAHGGWSVYYFDEQVGQFMGDERAVRPRSRTQDLRYPCRVLAARPRGSRRQATQRRHQVRREAIPRFSGATRS